MTTDELRNLDYLLDMAQQHAAASGKVPYVVIRRLQAAREVVQQLDTNQSTV